MKITIVAGPSFPVPAVLGGAMAKAWHQLALEFAARGHDVTMMCRSFPGQAATERADGIALIRSGGFDPSGRIALDLARDFAYAAGLLPRLPRADVLVVNDFWLPALAPWLRARAGRVFVCAARFPKQQYGLYRGVHRVVALSRAVANAVRDQQPRLADRIRVIGLPVGVDVPQGTPASPVLQYVGRVHPEKGVHLLVQAFARLANDFPAWRLRIVGPVNVEQGGGGADYERALRDDAAGSPVEFTGPVFDRNELAQTYANAGLLCYPSLAERGEAFGVVPLESMAAGVPPVVSALECFADFVRDGDNGWVFDHRARDPLAALQDVLRAAMTNEAARLARGARAREEAAHHTAAAIAQRYLEEFALP